MVPARCPVPGPERGASRVCRWPGQDSNLRATDYESAALPLSYRALAASDAITGTEATGPAHRRVRYAPELMLLIPADAAIGQTLALLATFLGIGVIVNLLIFYIIAQVLGERKQNREYRPGGE